MYHMELTYYAGGVHPLNPLVLFRSLFLEAKFRKVEELNVALTMIRREYNNSIFVKSGFF